MTTIRYAGRAVEQQRNLEIEAVQSESVDPGLTVTERMEASGTAEQYLRQLRAATPDVIARAIRWLVTDPAADELRGTVVKAQAGDIQRRASA